MHRTPAGPRRRTRRALLAAALPAVLAAVALPSAAQAAGFVGVGGDSAANDLFYTDTSATGNNVTLQMISGEISIKDTAGGLAAGAPCRVVTGTEVRCPANIRTVSVSTFGGFDTVEYGLPHKGDVNLGEGNDDLIAGRRVAAGRTIEPVTYSGGGGANDVISYQNAPAGVTVDMADNLANDGRPNADRENVGSDFDFIYGSNHADNLFGTANNDGMAGLGGNDFIASGHGDDFFHTTPNDGADDYHGSDGTDTMVYAGRNQPLQVTLDSVANDGETGEGDNVRFNIENIIGGSAGDLLIGTDFNNRIVGGPGGDTIDARHGHDLIDEGFGPDGADHIRGGLGVDTVTYANRGSGVAVSLDELDNDGAPGERDNVRFDVESIIGTDHQDTLVGNDIGNSIGGLGGPDIINGLGGNDTLSAGASNNFVGGGTGNDVIFARNNEIDNVDCGENSNDADTLERDANENIVKDCETVRVGALRLTPKASTAKAGEPARLRLSWRHPQGWRKLRRVELRLARDGAPVGEVTIRPRGERISADGAVELVRKRSRLTVDGKTVTARLAVRLDESLAGQRLGVEVEATDTRGARQIERDAGTVRVAR